MSLNCSQKIVALEQVAHALNASNIKWSVCHGLENYPYGIGRDLDIVVQRGHLELATRSVCHCLREHGWIVLPNLQGWVWWIVAFRSEADGEIASLQIDLFDHLQWAITWVIDGPGMDSPLLQRGPFWDDPAALLGKTVILNGLSGGYKAFKDKPHYLKLTRKDADILAPLIKRISSLEPSQITDLLLEGSPANIELAFGILRKSVRIKSIVSPGICRRLKSALLKQWVVNLFPKKGAPVVLIQGESTDAWADTVEGIFSSLVFHKTMIYKEKSYTRREAYRQKRRSCLQCVSIYVQTEIPNNLRPDIKIITNSDGSAVVNFSKDKSHMKIASYNDTHQIKKVVMQFLTMRSSYLHEKHRIGLAV